MVLHPLYNLQQISFQLSSVPPEQNTIPHLAGLHMNANGSFTPSFLLPLMPQLSPLLQMAEYFWLKRVASMFQKTQQLPEEEEFVPQECLSLHAQCLQLSMSYLPDILMKVCKEPQISHQEPRKHRKHQHLFHVLFNNEDLAHSKQKEYKCC